MKNQYFFFLSLMLLIGCQPSEQKTATAQQETVAKPQPKKTNDVSLISSLERKKAAFNERASDERKKVYEDGIVAVAESGITKSAKQVGDKAPNFTLKNESGQPIELAALLKDGPVILTWYRGGWCPYCNITLMHMQELLPQFKAAGARVLALSPELPGSIRKTKQKNGVDIEMLNDKDNKIAKDYGVVFELTPEVAEVYKTATRMHKHNGNDRNELPLAATYIIDTDGTIKYAFLDADYRKRAEPSALLEFVKGLK